MTVSFYSVNNAGCFLKMYIHTNQIIFKRLVVLIIYSLNEWTPGTPFRDGYGPLDINYL